MILSCPACTTRYLVDPGALGTDGRRVRCARCQHTWHAEPPSDDYDDPQDVFDEPDDTDDDTDTDYAAADDEVVEAAAARRASARGRAQLPAVREEKPSKLWIAWVLLILIVAGLIVGAYVYRSQIVEIWPPAGKLYQTIGLTVEPPFTLETDGIKFENVIRGGQTTLLVTGMVHNRGDIRQPVPQLQVTLLDENRRDIYHWTAVVEKAVLGPRESIAFTTELANPPDSARFLKVDFLLEE